MITYHLRFVATCPTCKTPDKVDIHGLGKSHAEWIRRLEEDKKLPDWQCRVCKKSVTAHLDGVVTVQEGKE